jgi:hypothetical protein
MNKTTAQTPQLQAIHAFCQNALVKLAKEHQMRVPQIQIDDRLAKHNASLTAMYLPDHHIILMNRRWVATANPTEVLMTLFHEFRHSYQAEAVRGQAKLEEGLDLNILKSWESELAHPVQPDADHTDDPNYLNQLIERDAVAYAKRALAVFFSQGN